MVVKSEIHRGLIKRGYTKLNSTINIIQTAPMQLTVKAGVFTDVQGNNFRLENDIVIDLASDPNFDFQVLITLIHGVNGVDVWLDQFLLDGLHYNASCPNGYTPLIVLAGYESFIIPKNTTSLDNIDIFVLKVID